MAAWYKMGAAVLAVLLYLTLIDLAVETFVNGSPLRWVVGGIVAGYVGLTVLLWRRLAWPAKAAISFFLILGLLTATAWLPGGLTQGVSLARQPRSTIFVGISALAILAASISILRLKLLPPWARVAFGLLAIYGITGFVLGIRAATSYSELLRGRSEWQRLPFWLQGAFIGAFVIVPIVMVFQIAHGVMRVRGRALRGLAGYALALSMVLAIAVAGFLAPGGFVRGPVAPAGVVPRFGDLVIALDRSGNDPTSTIPADTQTIYAVWRIERIAGRVLVEGRWIAAKVEGLAPDTLLATSEQVVERDSAGSFSLARPSEGWKPGTYRVEVAAKSGASRVAEFVIGHPVAGGGTGPTAGGQVEAVLAKGVADTSEPISPAAEFPEDAEKIYLALKSNRTDAASLQVAWIAVQVEGYEPNKEVAQGHLTIGPGRRGAIWFGPPPEGFYPGDYRADLSIDGRTAQSLSFKIVPILPPTALADQTPAPRGYNIALRALGGQVLSASSQYDDRTWSAGNLIDGAAYIRDGRSCRVTCGWSSKDKTVPQEIVLSFYQQREAMIAAVLIDPLTWETAGRRDRMAKHVEIWVSTTSVSDGFVKVTGARLHQQPGEQFMTFSPVAAKFVKVRFLSNYGGPHTQAGEIKIIEATGQRSIVADAPKDLVLPALGGAIVRYTSKRNADPAAYLTDGGTDTSGWRSEQSTYGPASYLPQEFVLAFRGDQVALVDRVAINPKTEYDPATWAKQITISVSTDSPLDGFDEVGQFTLTQGPRDQEFPVNRRARFVRVRILKNYGGPHTSLGEVKIFEGTAQGYDSVLLTEAATSASAASTAAPVDESGIAQESEPNNTTGEANPLTFGRRTKGTIDPLGEQDVFSLSIPGSQPAVLTLELLGRPNIRTSLTMLDASGAPKQRFDPGKLPGQRAVFSWLVPPGQRYVQVTEPPVSLVLIWDTSGSMDPGSVEKLKQAVLAYLDQVRPSERLNLIRFSDSEAGKEVEVLLPEFTSDRERLKAAAADKFFGKGGTPFYDAVAKGMELLAGVQGNKAIVVMTDGEDTTSRLDHAAFWKTLEEQRIRLYTIGLGLELPTYIPGIGTAGNRVLAHIALATNGRFFFARTAEELKGFYQQIADELRTLSTYYLTPTLSAGPGSLSVVATGERIAAVSAPSQIELILDASGSMKLKVEGRPKIDIAKEVMAQIIKGLPDEGQVALRIYGHRIREGRPGDCQDSQLIFPFGKIDKPRMLVRVREIKALGTTPIAFTLRQVMRDFGNAPGEKMVILVTDGKEECGGSPSAVVSEMVARGFKIRLNIVGFALADRTTKEEMERVATLAGGKFYDANDANALREAIVEALAVPYDVLDAAGTRVSGGLTGREPIRVPEGVYTIILHAAGKPIEIRDVRVSADRFTKIVLKKEGQEIGVQVLGP